MAHDVISTCPVCQGELTVTRLHCRNCGTALEGEFGVGRFGRLEHEQLAFLESFLRSRGNLKEMERELGISYPTVRGRLEVLLKALGLGDGPAVAVTDEEPMPAETEPATPPAAATDEDLAAERRRILERLSRHELSADEAAVAIRALGRS
ncbi:MAG: DUF2089 domain-containing protein [Chloroflexi bacterium]|nr:MAG: DUF2089 domain-containing protein [Chloroflexota bacterium]